MTRDEANAFASALRRVGHHLQSLNAMGHLLRGDVIAATTMLAALPVETVRELSAAGAMLGSLCDEELIRRE